MLAFEQRDYCDFEVQFEVIHNAIHSWVGGRSPYGMVHQLEFTSYDPLLLHPPQQRRPTVRHLAGEVFTVMFKRRFIMTRVISV